MPATIILIKTFLCVGAFISILGLLHPAKALLGQMLLENAFKAGGEQPWPGTDLRPIGKLQFSRLGIQKIILSNASGQAMAWGPAIFGGTKLPDSKGITIIVGHRDSHMTFLKDLKKGDLLEFITLESKKLRFIVNDRRVVGKTLWLPIVTKTLQPEIILVTCWPIEEEGPTDKRFLVHLVSDN
tara:strand:+ start:1456 stop:2007 length:552 start_codon:yes stop_codon:yes gene_type:complete